MDIDPISFEKYHGIGNDFIIVDGQSIDMPWQKLAPQLCDRHYGIGADGIIVVTKSTDCDFGMKIWNSDGSQPEMCGNGLRCVAAFAVDHHLCDKTMSVETDSGVRYPKLINKKGPISMVSVDMGCPELRSTQIPIAGPSRPVVVNEIIAIDGRELAYTGVSMGNPHCVIFVDDVSVVPIEKWGPEIEKMAIFPNQINVEFVTCLSRDLARMVVWERGAGPTLACGTGACAVVVAGILTGRLDRTAKVMLPGGELDVSWPDANASVEMIGPAEKVYSGQITIA